MVELFLADRENWGNIFAIRTGSGDFGKWCMTSRMHRGGMPLGHRQRAGYLWDERTNPPTKIVCPEEEDWFGALGLPVLPPAERDERGIEKARRQIR